MLLRHVAQRADSRAACTAGNSMAISKPMMAITTSNSTSVIPLRFLDPFDGGIGRFTSVPLGLSSNHIIAVEGNTAQGPCFFPSTAW
jgi:hypothetical protein